MAVRLAGAIHKLTDRQGRYDATKLAHELDWTQEEVARYLGKTPSAVSKNPTSLQSQDGLARLAALYQRLLDFAGGSAPTAAWLRTPIRVLDNASPKELILAGEIEVIESLLDEMDAGFAM